MAENFNFIKHEQERLRVAKEIINTPAEIIWNENNKLTIRIPFDDKNAPPITPNYLVILKH